MRESEESMSVRMAGFPIASTDTRASGSTEARPLFNDILVHRHRLPASRRVPGLSTIPSGEGETTP